MRVDAGDLTKLLQVIMVPDNTSLDIPTFRSMPVEMVRNAADASGVTMTEDEIRLVAETMVHPVAIGTWNLIDPSQDELEVSGLEVARPAFHYAVAMHVCMVLLGIALLAVSLGASVNGSTQLAAAVGGLGVSSLTALFLTAPLEDLYRSLGTRVQLEIIGLGHQRQMDLYRMYAKTTRQDSHFRIDAEVLPRIAAITERTLQQVERLGEPGGAVVLPEAKPIPLGEVPIAMALPETLTQGQKVPMEDKRIMMDKLPTSEAPMPSAIGHAGSIEQGRTGEMHRKVFMEPKRIVMDKAPLMETSPLHPDQTVDRDPEPPESG